jgi:ribosomal protein S12 methylthiotransferase accessory factor
VGNFTIHTDQSEKYGGNSSAPEPFDLFLASIASCAGIYAWNFCQSRNLPTEGLGLSMECARDEQKKLFCEMKLMLKLPEDFPDRYRDGIIRAMGLCTVKRHLQDAPAFTFEILD